MGRSIRHPTRAQVLRLHAAVLEHNGGRPGLRHAALLESAIAAPQATFAGESIMDDAVEVAAAYLFYLCRNHPFVDGNKRVALATCLVVLRVNGIEPKPDSPEWESFVLDIAASRLDRAAATERLRGLLL